MKWLRSRFLSAAYLALLTVVLLAGCTIKEDPTETLPLCGNHSCGNLVMVNTDTSSSGWQYLEPELSPEGKVVRDARVGTSELADIMRQSVMFVAETQSAAKILAALKAKKARGEKSDGKKDKIRKKKRGEKKGEKPKRP